MQLIRSIHLFRPLLAGAMLVLANVAAPAREHAARSSGVPGRFDYYLVSLSWSPSYCLTHPDDPEECGNRGYGFVLHGLWPQYRDGGWPQHCASAAAPTVRTVERTLAFMPSRRLIEHEWLTHGSCTGLDPDAYFELADRAFAAIRIPPPLRTPERSPALSAEQVVRAFAAANPGLDDGMISVQCHDGYELTEVRVCVDKDTLAPQRCGGRVRNSCRYGTLKIPAVR